MAMSDDEKEYFVLVIETSINKAIKPVMDKLAENTLDIQSQKQTLNGINGSGGLIADHDSLKKRVSRFYVIGGLFQGFGVGLGFWLKTIFKD